MPGQGIRVPTSFVGEDVTVDEIIRKAGNAAHILPGSRILETQDGPVILLRFTTALNATWAKHAIRDHVRATDGPYSRQYDRETGEYLFHDELLIWPHAETRGPTPT